MTDLPDVNVWLALVDENHIHHPRAVAYWRSESSPAIAFCRVTTLGFLRLSTHPKVLSRPLAGEEAWNVYHRYRSEAGVGYVDDSAATDLGFREHSSEANFPHHLWTDAYLAALAQFRNCRIVSFDADFDRFPRLNFLHLSM
jgi:toxin-antitoxin system PIN domain toxin